MRQVVEELTTNLRFSKVDEGTEVGQGHAINVQHSRKERVECCNVREHEADCVVTGNDQFRSVSFFRLERLDAIGQTLHSSESTQRELRPWTTDIRVQMCCSISFPPIMRTTMSG